MPLYTDTAAYPSFDANSVGKKEILQYAELHFIGNPALEDFLYRVNNMAAMTDVSTTYDPVGTWANSV